MVWLFNKKNVGVLLIGCLINAPVAMSAEADVANNAPLTTMPSAQADLGAPPLNLPPINSQAMPVENNQMNPANQQIYNQMMLDSNQNPITDSRGVPINPNMMQLPGDVQIAPQSTFGTVNDPVFENVVKKQFPLTPDQITKLREVMQDTQRAAGAPLAPPTPTVSSQTVSLAPGTVPPVIRLATGYVSSIVFFDETGQPLPIVGYSIGNPSAFNVQWDQKSNVLMMQGVGAYQSGNLAVQLTGLSMPVMVTIVNDQKIVDYRVDLRLQGRGPNARASLMSNAVPASADPLLLNLLEGIPPQGSEALTIKGGDAQGWLLNNTIYLRTRLTILSPGWNSTMTSPDGMRVYELNATPMILASDQGQTVTLKVEGL